MATFLKVTGIVNLTRDIELVNLPSGTVKASFGVAANRRYTTNGEQREETTFADVEAFGKQAETLAQHVGKGRAIYIEARLSQQNWEDKNTGAKRSKHVLTLEQFQFLPRGDAGDDTDQRQQPRTNRAPLGKRPVGAGATNPIGDDQTFDPSEIPF